jgi:predicted GIY-YIG superfamily endonuclease
MIHKIYKYTNRINGHSYIGRTQNLKQRHKAHSHGNDDCRYFNNAMNHPPAKASGFPLTFSV